MCVTGSVCMCVYVGVGVCMCVCDCVRPCVGMGVCLCAAFQFHSGHLVMTCAAQQEAR